MPNSTLASDNVDYVYVGRASGNIIHFATAIYEGTDVTSIPDILSKNDVSTDQKYTIQDYKIDYTNFPRIPWEDFDFSYLLTSNKTFNYFTSTGCTGSCTFCSWGGKHPWSRIPTNYVLDDIQYLVSKYNLSFIWFADSTFTANKNTNLEIAQGIIDRKIDIAWRCHSRVLELNKFNKEDFILLENSGLDQIYLGVESLCNNVQKLIHKVFSPDKVTEIVQKMKGLHIRIVMSFIYGFPGVSQDDFEVCMPYFEKWKSINPEVYYQCGFYTPYPGTPMTEKAVSLGYSLPKNLEEYGDFDVYYGLENKNIELPWMKKEYCINYINNIKKKFPSHNGVFELWEKRKKNKLPAFQKEES